MLSSPSKQPTRTFFAVQRLIAAVAVLLSLACAPVFGAQAAAPGGAGQPQLTVDALSVVKIKSQAVRDARSSRSLGNEREGTGVVIDSNGLVLTIGYLVTEAEKVELSTADGKVFPATVVGYDNATGMGLVRAL